MIKKEQERGYFRKTVLKLIEGESESKKLIKKKEKEKEEEYLKDEKSGKCEDEADGLVDKENREDKEGKEEGASDNSPLRLLNTLTIRHYPNSPTYIDAAIQNTNLNNSQAVVDIEQGEASKSPKELDEGPQRVDTDRVTEYHLDNKKEEERVQEEQEEEKNTPETKTSR